MQLKLKGIYRGIEINKNLKPEIKIEIKSGDERLLKLQDKEIILKLETMQEKRTINANAYYWGLLGILKDILGLSLEELHLKMLEDYGVGDYIKVDKRAGEIIEKSVKYYKKLDETETYAEYLILLGSSEMNKEQFSRLLQGVINEAEAQGIRTLETEEIERMIEERSF